MRIKEEALLWTETKDEVLGAKLDDPQHRTQQSCPTFECYSSGPHSQQGSTPKNQYMKLIQPRVSHDGGRLEVENLRVNVF